MKEPQIQIPRSLFNELLIYFGGDHSLDREKRIKSLIDTKINAMVRREYYTQYKTAMSDADKERARQNYLDAAGIPEDFRW